MQPSVFRALEFDRVRTILARVTLTSIGRERARRIEPATTVEDVHAGLTLTVEAAAFAAGGGSLALSAPDNLDDILAELEIDGHPLEPLHLTGLARLLGSVDTVVASIDRTAARPGQSPSLETLAAVARVAASFAAETAAVHRAIDPSGDVNDRASAALAEIRDALRRQRARLRAALETITHARDTAKYLQDQIVTDRHGRYVVVLRAEHRQAIPGIVHGTSASGASLYVEPMGTVELNNDVVALVEREREEIRRILLALSNGFRQRADELTATLDVAAELDVLYAKTELARKMDGVAPSLSDDGRLEFIGARHPLLIPAVRDLAAPEDGGEGRPRPVVHPVASDLRVVPPASALVISGPNTGGKTVALKAAGLLALMAQSGLLIPVEAGSAFTPFATIFADIGDEQSIAASLSTFSAHVANLVAMERALELPALVLLDEVGGGTDPTEGGALGAAVIDHFRRRGALVIATTHDDALKSYAATTAGVLTAGFGFNPDTYAPTYRLLYGAPGRSLALEIAARLGMPPEVIADARARRSGRESQLAAHLARVDEELAALERERQSLAADRRAAADERARLVERESRLTEREAVLKRRLDDRLNERLREARTEVDRIVGSLKKKAESLAETAERRAAAAAPVLSTGDLGQLRAEARAALGAIPPIGPEGTGDPEALPLESTPDVGDLVFVTPFRADGMVRSVSGKNADVEIRGKRMRVRLQDLRRPQAAPAARGVSARGAAPRVQVTTAPREGRTSRELVVVGATVDEAIGRAEKFLDDALLADERSLRIVHGHGTGRLREALTRFFREHPLVASVAPASEADGGGAATIVELKD